MKDKCWVCGDKGAAIIAEVKKDKPGGKSLKKPKKVKLHWACYIEYCTFPDK